MTNKLRLGKDGESKAERFLISRGYEIVARNYRFKRSEIDLIIKKDNWLVFVEVKLRSNAAFGHPEEFVTAKKRRKVMEGAAQYLLETNWQGNVRYDIVALTQQEIVHFEDAFY